MNLTGDVIAGVAALSKYHFGKAFRQSTGVTLHGYVLARRIRRAEQLLIKSDLPLVAIRRRQRVCEQSHFTTVFSTRNAGRVPPDEKSVYAPFHLPARENRSILKDRFGPVRLHFF